MSAIGSPPPLRYTEADSDRAQRDWKATCGPHALAAACGLTLAMNRSGRHEYVAGHEGCQGIKQLMVRVGKDHAGRVLDGQTHGAVPMGAERTLVLGGKE